MEKLIIDPYLRGKELFKFLRENRKGLIDQKKSMIKYTDTVISAPYFVDGAGKLTMIGKSAGQSPIAPDANSLMVKVVANTSLFLDSDMDVLLRDNAAKSIQQRGKLIKHLKNHGRTLDDQVGDVKNIYYQDIPLTQLGWPGEGTAQALIFETNILKQYDASTFNKYKNGMIDQHSIGLMYVKLDVAFKDEEDQKEMDFWNKYYPMIINPAMADENGYFYVVPEIKLIENSAVLFGSNSLTPTLETDSGKSIPNDPEKSIHEDPHEAPAFDLSKAISQTKFF